MFKNFGYTFLFASIFLFNCTTSSIVLQHENEPIKPNIVLILLDDLGYGDVGFNGCKDIPTPNIDRIANNGVKFTNAYVSYAVCGPSRAGLITGRYQDRFGFGRNPLFAPNDPNQGLPLTEQTLASALGSVGYTNMAIGKWHLGAHESQRPLNRGFNEFFGFLTGGHRYFPSEWTLKDISEVNSQYAAYKTKLLRNNDRIEETAYLTDALSREAVEFIKKRKSETPFFLYLAYNAPHAPLQATEQYLKRFEHIQNEKRRIYAAMVSAVDDGVGHLLNQLEDKQMMEHTIIFFLSDNGGPEKSNGSDNGSLRGGKGELFEGGIHVPFAMQWKGQIPAGSTYNKPVSSLDIFATAVKQAGASPKNPIDGVDLIPFLTGKNTDTPHQQLFWRKFDNQAYAVRAADYKIIKENKVTHELLFNLTNDIGESEVVEQAAKALELKKAYDDWNSEMMNPVFLGLKQNKAYNKIHPNRFITKPY